MIRNHDVDNQRFAFGTKKSILLILNYFIGYEILFPLVGQSFFGTAQDASISPKAIMFSTLLSLFLSLYIVKDVLKKAWNNFKLNWRKNIKIAFQSLILIYILNFVFSLAVNQLTGLETSSNQEILEQGFYTYPVLIGFSAVFFAPIVEELIFRGVLYQQIRNRKSYVVPTIISSFTFGLIHVLPTYLIHQDVNDLLFIIVYASMGFVMVRAYEKTGNIWTSILVHFMNNFVATVVLLSSL